MATTSPVLFWISLLKRPIYSVRMAMSRLISCCRSWNQVRKSKKRPRASCPIRSGFKCQDFSAWSIIMTKVCRMTRANLRSTVNISSRLYRDGSAKRTAIRLIRYLLCQTDNLWATGCHVFKSTRNKVVQSTPRAYRVVRLWIVQTLLWGRFRRRPYKMEPKISSTQEMESNRRKGTIAFRSQWSHGGSKYELSIA